MGERLDRAEEQLDLPVDLTVNKYVAVWLWSVLFVVTAVYTVFAALAWGFYSNLNEIGFVLIPLYGLSSLAVLISWVFLLRYLVVLLIPIFFTVSASSEQQAVVYRRGASLLKGAVLFLLIAFGFGIITNLFDQLWQILRYSITI